MNDCVIKIIIYVIGSSKERLQHIQLYLHRSWCTHMHKKVSTFICIIYFINFGSRGWLWQLENYLRHQA